MRSLACDLETYSPVNLAKSGVYPYADDPEFELLYDSVPNTLSQLIRTAFIPSEGCQFIVADYLAIEVRVIVWLAGETSTLQAFRDGTDL